MMTGRRADAVVVPAAAAQAGGVTPSVEQLFRYAAEQITVAAAELWPRGSVKLAEHLPSVTSYVRRIEVGERSLYAKYSFMGSSLVSVLQGKYGDWDHVRATQRAYSAAPGSLLGREAAQLRLLHRLGLPRACRLVGYRRGVLFTEPVPGLSLAQLLCRQPQRTRELMERTWEELRGLHHLEGRLRLTRESAIEERSIAGTFLRKFTGRDGEAYLDRLAGRNEERRERVALVRGVVTTLCRLRLRPADAAMPVMAYGDLKPEHVVFESQAISGDRPVFIDPSMIPERDTVDAAKLMSRIVLLLVSSQAGTLTRRAICDGLAAFVDDQIDPLPATAREGWLRELVGLWLMDTVNILTTYLCAPADLPLPAHAAAVLSQAEAVWMLVARVSDELVGGADPYVVCRRGLADLANPDRQVGWT